MGLTYTKQRFVKVRPVKTVAMTDLTVAMTDLTIVCSIVVVTMAAAIEVRSSLAVTGLG
jgi:hypothetical protein